jgi:hypothetical protein
VEPLSAYKSWIVPEHVALVGREGKRPRRINSNIKELIARDWMLHKHLGTTLSLSIRVL